MTTTDDPTGSVEDPVPPSDGNGARASTFASFAIGQFRIIWVGTFLYYLAIFSSIVARGALAKELGGTNTALGVVTLAFGAVSLVMTPIGGVMADRLPKRRILVAATALLALTSLGLGITEALDITRFWMLIVVSGLQAVAFAILVPARMAFTVDLVGPKLIPNAVALAQVSLNSNRVLGPAVAGVFLGVAWLGFAAVYFFSAALALAGAFCFLLLGPGDPNPDRPQRAPLAEMADGVRYANSVPSVRLVVGLSIAVTMVGFPYVAFLPSVSEDFYGRGAEGFAWLSLIGALGGLLAGILVARSVLAQGPRIQVSSGLLLAVGLAAIGIAPTFATALGAAFIVGASTAGFQTMNATLALSLSEAAYHGRIQSLLGLGFSAFGLASLPLGVLADWIGLRETFLLMALITALLVVGGELVWRRDRPEELLAIADRPGAAR
ncbi:MAG: MFS transporter [Actinomycetota bacterium]